jgi:PAS domain S-box-containing protein
MNQRVEGQDSALIDPPDGQEQMQRQLADLERQNTELRNLLEMQSHESQKQYQIVLQHHPDGICLVNEQGQVIVWNEAIARITGIAVGEVVGKWIWDVQFQLMPEERRIPEAYEKLKTDLKSFLKTGQAPWSEQRLEREYFQADGSLVYIEGSVYSIPTDEGYLLVSVSKDISKRKQVEQALIASEELSRSTLNGLPAHIAIIDQEGKILAVNQAWKDFARENGADPEKTNEGANYLEVSYNAKGPNSAEGTPFFHGIKAVLAGRFDKFEMEYPCHSKNRERWFIGRVTRFPTSGYPRAVIAHEDISTRKAGEEALRQAHTQLTTLIEISRTIVSTLHLEPLLNLILSKLAGVIRYSGAAVITLESGVLVVQAYRGPELAAVPTDIHIALSQFREIRRLIQTKQPFYIRDINDHPYILAEVCSSLDQPKHVVQNFRSWFIVPLTVKEIQIGIMVVAHRQANHYNHSAREMVEMLANNVAIAIQNAQLYHQARISAVLEERNRLARELHDSVAQTLYSINLYANATSRALSAGKMQVALNHLKELQRSSEEAVADMRLLIFELRPPVLEEDGLVEAVRTRLELVEARSGIKASLQVVGNPQIPKNVETELYRVIQEALNNILKHAKATQVNVKIVRDHKRFQLTIQDNGAGFDPTLVEKSGGLGYQIIQERVHQIGGSFRVEAAPQQGTALTIELNW